MMSGELPFSSIKEHLFEFSVIENTGESSPDTEELKLDSVLLISDIEPLIWLAGASYEENVFSMPSLNSYPLMTK